MNVHLRYPGESDYPERGRRTHYWWDSELGAGDWLYAPPLLARIYKWLPHSFVRNDWLIFRVQAGMWFVQIWRHEGSTLGLGVGVGSLEDPHWTMAAYWSGWRSDAGICRIERERGV